MTSFKKGGIYILSSPSGAGKTTLVKKISKNRNFSVSISHTTRLPRPNEKNGKDYFFTSKNNFKNFNAVCCIRYGSFLSIFTSFLEIGWYTLNSRGLIQVFLASKKCFIKQKIVHTNGQHHTAQNRPVLVRSLKSNQDGQGQYLHG